MTLDEFIRKYGVKSPKKPGDCTPLNAGCPLRHMEKAPAEADIYVSGSSLGSLGRNLWVFAKEKEIPYIREAPGIPCAPGALKHTNLTAGTEAACGGELWVDYDDHSLLYLNGASGRYGPDSEVELADAVSVFRDLGYQVTSFGWDEEADKPARVWRE